MRIPVYLSNCILLDSRGREVAFPERRLVRRRREDRVIAIIEAPPGTRVRRRRDQHGAEQLLVPVGNSAWARLFGERVVIPAKYVIGSARQGAHGLAIVELALAEGLS